VAIILGLTAIVGFILGTWIGRPGPNEQGGVGASLVTPSPSATATAIVGPSTPIPVENLSPLSGSADLTTDPFTAQGVWQLDWETSGETFALTIDGEPDIGQVIDQTGAGKGTISPIPAGTFRIQVRAVGPWTIRASPAPASASAAPSLAGPREIILQFSGTEHDVSEPFEVLAGWQIQWQTDGASLAIAVTGDQNLGIVVDEPGPASGVTSLAPAGNFRLDIAANGPWSITILQGEEPAASPS
jgi:hypothetical protein